MIAGGAQQFAFCDRGQRDRRVAAGVGELAVILGGFGGGFGLGRLVFGLGLARTGREQEQDAERRHKRGSHHFSPRSEEHTSELQSLMRISYAVFCLNKKKNTHQLVSTS